ncbi:MAG: DUF2730 domain-containing protein [Shinella sp.]|nr:MAG: DUF2730 domain-containing protein [Shinella sp.]
MNFEPQIILLWGNLFLSLAAVAGHIKNWMSSGEKQLTKDQKTQSVSIERHESKLTDHDRRIQTVENELKHLPDKDTVNELRVAMTRMAGDVGILSESMGSISRTVHRIDDYLRTEGKG